MGDRGFKSLTAFAVAFVALFSLWIAARKSSMT
jgi:hypothetical protein